MMPTSPSLTARGSEDAPRSATSLAPRRVDADGDGYEDPEPGPPSAPETPPANPGEVPPPVDMPPAEGIPAPVQLTVNIVGSFGPTAFAPNPQQAAIGNTIVWMNNDFAPHNIVLSDGTPVGNLAPGQASAPITLVTDTLSYQCTFHPSMTGQITPIAPLPLPTDPSQIPVPADPSAPPMPPADPYGDGYDEGYDYDYY